MIAAILVARFSGRSIPEICAMGGLTIDDFTSSAIYKEIFGLGQQEGLEEGRQEGRREGRREGRKWVCGRLDDCLAFQSRYFWILTLPRRLAPVKASLFLEFYSFSPGPCYGHPYLIL